MTRRVLASLSLISLAACAGPRPRAIAYVALASLAGCGPSLGKASAQHGFTVPEPPPSGKLNQAQAERYVLKLINQDRQAQGLEPVTWDETAAKAGLGHARDMAARGFTAHIGSDGSVPEQRYTLAGGTSMSMENAGCLADGKERPLDPNPMYLPAQLERIQKAFMDEVPPHDGHRRNILTPWHTAVGVGLAQVAEVDIPCMAQEFVDNYGVMEALPASAKVGQTIRVAGEVRAPATFSGVGVARIDFPRPVDPINLNKARSYSIPAPHVTYFPEGYKTPIPVAVSGGKFHIDLPLSDKGKPGLYEISVWAKLPGQNDLIMISLRTISVR